MSTRHKAEFFWKFSKKVGFVFDKRTILIEHLYSNFSPKFKLFFVCKCLTWIRSRIRVIFVLVMVARRQLPHGQGWRRDNYWLRSPSDAVSRLVSIEHFFSLKDWFHSEFNRNAQLTEISVDLMKYNARKVNAHSSLKPKRSFQTTRELF